METIWSLQCKDVKSFAVCFFFNSGNLHFSALFPFPLDSSFTFLLKVKEKGSLKKKKQKIKTNKNEQLRISNPSL